MRPRASLKSTVDAPIGTGPVEVKVKTICLASSLVIGCKDEDCGFVDHSVAPIAAKIEQQPTSEREVPTMQ